MGLRKVSPSMKGNKRGKVTRGVWAKDGLRLIPVICSATVFLGAASRNSYYGESLVLGKFSCFRALPLTVFLAFISPSCTCEEDCGRMAVHPLAVAT